MFVEAIVNENINREYLILEVGDTISGNVRSYNQPFIKIYETIEVDLALVDHQINEVLFVVTIHDATVRKQNFGQVRNSYIRIVDENSGAEVAKYELDEDFSIETAVEFGRLYKREGKWKFEASGIGYKEDLAYFVSKYYQGQIIK